MVFSAALITTTTTGVGLRAAEPAPVKPTIDLPEPGYKFQALAAATSDKHDVQAYVLANAPFIGLAGLVAGLQEAFYAFEKMPPEQTRRTVHQALTLGRIIGRKTLLGTAMGAAFCYTEASLENARGHDMLNGMAGGAAAGLVFGLLPYKPWPQPLAWPLFFAAAAATADIVAEKIPQCMHGFKQYGPVLGRENWGDVEPPRPPILETGSSARPHLGNFTRGA